MLRETAGKRGEWTVVRTTDQMLKDLAAKVAYHTSRATHWEEQYKLILTEAQASLASVEVPEAELYRMSSTNYNQHNTLAVPQSIQERVKFIDGKRKSHAGAVQTFENWAAFVRACPEDEEFVLEIGDFEYFCVLPTQKK